MIIEGQNKVSISGEMWEAYSSGQTKEPAVTDVGSQTGVDNEGAYLAFVALGDIAEGVSGCKGGRPDYPAYAIPDRRRGPRPETMYGVPPPRDPKPPPVTKYGIPRHEPRPERKK